MFKLFSLVCLVTVFANAQDVDVLLQKNVTIKTAHLDDVLKKTEDNVKAFAENFQVRLDSNSKVTTPAQVSGTILQPVFQVSIKKCVFLFCQTIDLDAEFTLKESNKANCTHHYDLLVDLSRSSQMLTDLYSSINTDICVQKTDGGANVSLQVNLLHADTYDTGAVQRQAFELIRLQGQSIFQAFQTVMKLNGATL